jgi:hypothetical protein
VNISSIHDENTAYYNKALYENKNIH